MAFFWRGLADGKCCFGGSVKHYTTSRLPRESPRASSRISLFGGGGPAPPDPLVSVPVFSPDFYIGIYPDLQQAFGRTGYVAQLTIGAISVASLKEE